MPGLRWQIRLGGRLVTAKNPRLVWDGICKQGGTVGDTGDRGDKGTEGQGHRGTRRHGNRETWGQGDKGTGGQGDTGERHRVERRDEGKTNYAKKTRVGGKQRSHQNFVHSNWPLHGASHAEGIPSKWLYSSGSSVSSRCSSATILPWRTGPRSGKRYCAGMRKYTSTLA